MREKTKEEMIEFLRDMRARREFIRSERERLRSCVETKEEAIRRNSFSKNGDDLGIQFTGCNKDKVLNILLNSLRDIEDEQKEATILLHGLKEQEDEIFAVEYCVNALPTKERELITEVYINAGSPEIVADTMNLSVGYAYRVIKKGIGRLIIDYNRHCFCDDRIGGSSEDPEKTRDQIPHDAEVRSA